MTNKYRHVVNVGGAERIASLVTGGALVGWGLSKKSLAGASLAALGGSILHRGVTGHCPVYQALGIHTSPRSLGAGVPYELGIRIDKSIVIDRPAEEVYSFWRNLENLPRFMPHLRTVEVLDDRHSRWVVEGPAGSQVEWVAETINDVEDRLIAWRSLPGSQVESGGSVRFEPAPGGPGTEVRVSLQYNPPGGVVGNVFSKLFGADPAHQIAEDLQKLKQIMETGGVPATGIRRRRRGIWSDEVMEASEDSFPASDAPAWTSGR